MTHPLAAAVAQRLTQVHDRIVSAGGDLEAVTVIAVTKGFPADVVKAAWEAGCSDIGENYATELIDKAAAVRAEPGRVVWHYLGAVQRNKVKALAPHVSLWQGVDRIAEGIEIARHAPGAAVLVQVLLAPGEGRAGCAPDEAPALVEGLRGLGLDVRGLMGIAGTEDPRRDFAHLARLGAFVDGRELSMGMSGDLEAAVAEGATMVRVGTALFGARPGRL